MDRAVVAVRRWCRREEVSDEVAVEARGGISDGEKAEEAAAKRRRRRGGGNGGRDEEKAATVTVTVATATRSRR